MYSLAEGTVQVWYGDRLLAPSEYDVDYAMGVVTLGQPTKEQLRIAAKAERSPKPLQSNLRKQAQWKREHSSHHRPYWL